MTQASAPNARWRADSMFGLLVAAVVFAGATAGYLLRAPASGISVIWPPSGILLAVLLLSDLRRWPLALAMAIAANITADVLHNIGPLQAIGGGLANALESLVAAAVVRRVAGTPVTLGSLRQAAAFILGAVVLSSMLTSLAGALVLTHGGLHRYWHFWTVWWIGDSMGMLVFAPIILTVADLRRSARRLRPSTVVEMAVVLALIAWLASTLLRLDPSGSGTQGNWAYAIFPLLVWAAVRHGAWAAALATATLSSVLIIALSETPQLFMLAGTKGLGQAVYLYIYMAVASITSIVPAAIVTERRTVERRLRESEQRFRQMAEHIREAFFVVDLGARVPLYASPMWATIAGRPSDEAATLDGWFAAVHPDDRARVASAAGDLQRGAEVDMVFRVVRPAGEVRWVRTQAVPVRDERGVPYRVTGVCDDITAQRVTEDHLRQSQKMDALGRLASGVAHDFNNLLSVITGAAALMELGIPEDHEAHQEISIVQSAAASAAGLTRRLLAFSRQQPARPDEVRLNALVKSTGEMLSRLLGESVQVRYHLDAKKDAIVADPNQLEQVFMNLAVNARDAMPGGGQLVVTSHNVDGRFINHRDGEHGRRTSYVCLTFRDSGTGMDAETAARIFEPFFTTKGPDGGTGLGLATVYGIVRQSGGVIRVDSALGQGTAFEICLPLAGAESLHLDVRTETLAG